MENEILVEKMKVRHNETNKEGLKYMQKDGLTRSSSICQRGPGKYVKQPKCTTFDLSASACSHHLRPGCGQKGPGGFPPPNETVYLCMAAKLLLLKANLFQWYPIS